MKKIFLILSIFLVILMIGCTTSVVEEELVDNKATKEQTIETSDDTMSDTTLDEVTPKTNQEAEETSELPEWFDIELKDVNTQTTFKLSDFKGKPILVESFAVWCPICTKQQKQIKLLHEDVGDSVISLALDTDPNEDESEVLDHTEKNGFDWLYSVSPTDLTEALIDEFGIGIVNAPSAPVILICEDQSFRKLRNGVKGVAELTEEIGKC